MTSPLRRHLSPWSLGLLVTGAIILVPFVIVFSGVFQTGTKWQHIVDTVLPGYIWNTVILAITVSLVSILFAVLPAWLVAAFRFPGSRIFCWALVLPLAIPTYVAAFVYYSVPEMAIPLLIKVRLGLGVDAYLWAEKILRYGVLSIVMGAVLYPYLYLSARASFAEQRSASIEAARTLGRGSTSVFISIALPLARPAIVAGLTLILMEVINDYGAVNFFGVPTLTEGIFRTWFGLGDRVSALRIAAWCMLAVLLLISLERWQRGTRGYSDRAESSSTLAKVPLRGVRAWLATLACVVPLAIGLIIPVVQLLVWAGATYSQVLTGDFLAQMGRTVSLALATAAGVGLLGLVMAYALNLHPHAFNRMLARLAAMGYAAPGAVIAVGVMVGCAALDRWSPSSRLFLSGTVIAIVGAYAIRFFTVAFEPIRAGMTRVGPQLADASRALGKSPTATLWRIELPLLRRVLLAAVMLVFVDILKELPLTMILRPANFDTLATTAFGLAKEGQIYQSAVPSMIIVVLGVAGLLWLSRYSSGPSSGGDG